TWLSEGRTECHDFAGSGAGPIPKEAMHELLSTAARILLRSRSARQNALSVHRQHWDTEPDWPRTPLSRPRPLGLDERSPPATYARSMNRKRRRSVAARPPSRLLTGTSARSEPVVLTGPAWR